MISIPILPCRRRRGVVYMEELDEEVPPRDSLLESDDPRLLAPFSDPRVHIPQSSVLSVPPLVLPVRRAPDIPVFRLTASNDDGFRISSRRLNNLFNFDTVYRSYNNMASDRKHWPNDRIVVSAASLDQLVRGFDFFSNPQLRSLMNIHKIHYTLMESKWELIDRILSHSCAECCSATEFFYVFKNDREEERLSKGDKMISRAVVAMRAAEKRAKRARTQQARISRRRKAQEASAAEAERQVHSSYATIPSDELLLSITKEWQESMSTCNFSRKVCACCGERHIPSAKPFAWANPSDVDLSLLRNEALLVALPELVPVGYSFETYQRAILCPSGLHDTQSLDRILLCQNCKSELVEKKRMPDLALANWFYYGYDSLPPLVREAFHDATVFEKMMVSRCHASRIVHRFSDNPDSNEFGRPRPQTQRYNKGNTMVVPLDTFSVNSCLPPSADHVRDTMCALFVGQNKPTTENIESLGPVLIRKSRVKSMIDFLVKNNPHYAPDGAFTGLCPANLEALCASPEIDNAPLDISYEHIEVSSSLDSTVSQSYTDRNEEPIVDEPASDISDDVLMENVGYTDGDTTSTNYERMRIRAIEHCLNGGKFISSKRGNSPVADFYEPSLLTWLYPHLDPYGIGGFFDPRRSVKVSLERQLRHLLLLDNSPFEKDATFAFVFYNILQKRNVVKSANFRIKEGQHMDIVKSLLEIKTDDLTAMAAKFEKDPRARPTNAQERALMRTIERLQLVCKDLPGSAAYKQCRRNEIKGLINRHGSPAFFVTINPSDIENPLVRLLAGHEINLEDASVGVELSWIQRRIFVANNPGSAALAFDTWISAFINKILRHGQNRDGLLGRTKAYYGMVEAQGKGTLHCHFLIWLDGHLSPQTLRDKMSESDRFRDRIFGWLESLIKCELPSTVSVVEEPDGKALPKPSRPSNVPHPTAVPSPVVGAGECWQDFKPRYEAKVEELVKELNWHSHSHTCWKYLKKGEKHDDAHCRMRIDGSTRERTSLDPETLSILLRRLHPRISRYNELLMFLLKCNNDIQYIGSGEAAKALIYYITNYITKENLPTHVGLAALAYAIEKSNDLYGERDRSSGRAKNLVTKAINAMLSKKEISHQQVMSILIGGGDYYTSHQFSILHWGAFDRLVSNSSLAGAAPPDLQVDENADTAENEDDGENLVNQQDSMNVSFNICDDAAIDDVIDDGDRLSGPASKSITASNQKNDYLLRSADPSFESLCLYDFVSSTSKITKSSEVKRLGNPSHRRGNSRGDFVGEHGQKETHMLRMKSVESVPVILGPTIPKLGENPTQDAAHHRALMVLFKPWRVPSDLKRPELTWTEAYNEHYCRFSDHHKSIMRNIQVLHECKDARDQDCAARRAREECSNVIEEGDREGLSSYLINDANLDYDAGEEYDTQITADPQLDNQEPPDASIHAIRILNAAGLGSAENEERAPDSMLDIDGSHLVSTGDMPDIKKQTALMDRLKKRKRPTDDVASNATAPPRTRRRFDATASEPAVSLAVLTSGTGPILPQIPWSGDDATADTSELGLVDRVISEANMADNPEQSRAMHIIGNHIISNSKEQLLMYVSGVGGTGKSHVINTVVKLFERLSRRKELLLSAPTGIAAVLIKGYTIHALTLLPKSRFKTIGVEELQRIWQNVRYLIIDEVSMVSAGTLAQVSQRISIGKAEDPTCQGSMFGGVNVLFFGDQGQLKPVRQKAMFSTGLVSKIGVNTAQSAAGQEEIYGAYLWRQVKTVVELKKNMRQQGDRQYSELLDRIRSGTAVTEHSVTCNTSSDGPSTSDYSTLLSRDLLSLKRRNALDLDAFEHAPIIVGTKALRDAINRKKVHDFATSSGLTVHDYCSRDRHSMVDFEGEERKRVWNISSSKTSDSLGKIPMVPGMKVMLRENVSIGNKVVNGTDGILTGLKYEEDEDGNRYACMAYVHIPGSNVCAPGLPPDTVPIVPTRTPFRYQGQAGGPFYSISRLQLPLLPAYSYTDYKSQGRSLDHAIVDLASAHSLQGAYVMLSRVRSLSGLAILRPFSWKRIEQHLSEEMRTEMKRISELAESTALAYNIMDTDA